MVNVGGVLYMELFLVCILKFNIEGSFFICFIKFLCMMISVNLVGLMFFCVFV